MPVRRERLRWDDDRVEHIVQHQVDIEEVLELYSSGNYHESRWENSKKRLLGGAANRAKNAGNRFFGASLEKGEITNKRKP